MQTNKKERMSKITFLQGPPQVSEITFPPKKRGILKTSMQELDEYLERMHADGRRHVQTVIPPIKQPEHQMDINSPKWREVEQAVK